MVVVLAGCGIEFPGVAAEVAEPVVGRPAAGSRIAPDVPVAFGVVARGARFLEPRMLVGRVVRHEVEHQLHAAAMDLGDQLVEIGERAEDRVDVGVIGNVVAEVGHRRRIDRRQPDGIDAEPLQVVEPRKNSRQVANAVAVRVLERARIDLIDDSLLPPFMLLTHGTPPCAPGLTTCSALDCARRPRRRHQSAARAKIPNCCNPLAHFPAQTCRIARRSASSVAQRT